MKRFGDIDWTSSMIRTFEFYTVDPLTWRDRAELTKVSSFSIQIDDETDTIMTANVSCDDQIGEEYVRAYMRITQPNVPEYVEPIGTFLLQSPSVNFDGIRNTSECSGYSPLIELKENQPPVGYYIPTNSNIADFAETIIEDNSRLKYTKLIPDSVAKSTVGYDFAANEDDTWLRFLSDWVAISDRRVSIDANGRLIFVPIQSIDQMTPVWSFTNGENSIMDPNISYTSDWYGIPNQYIATFTASNYTYTSIATNTDTNSPTSVPNRGRVITKFDRQPEISGIPSQAILDEYAKTQLISLSTLTYEVQFKHAYCPVEVGDCVTLKYPEAGLNGVKARIVRQDFQCDAAMTVNATAQFQVKTYDPTLTSLNRRDSSTNINKITF